MAFLEDPRLRQRWNQITQDAETVTENAAAGIWSFQHNYINPCLGSVADSIEQCTTICLGDPEERLIRRRERERTTGRAEYSFDFYDDWYGEEEQGGGGGSMFGSWGGEDWDRLLAGTGSQRKHTGRETTEQPQRKRGMSYGTRGSRRATNEQDPTIIPSTQPIGFLSKLPWKMGGTLRYKPSAADLQDHPGKVGHGESEPLLGSDDESDYGEVIMPRQRSNTTGSGATSDSYRSRGDLFPSDGEGEEDAVPLDDEITYDMVRNDRSSSGKSSRTRSSKGKRPAGLSGSRTFSRSTLGSAISVDSLRSPRRSSSLPATPDAENPPSLDDLAVDEARLREEEDAEIAKKKAVAAQLAAERGFCASPELHSIPETKPEIVVKEEEPKKQSHQERDSSFPPDHKPPVLEYGSPRARDGFMAARLPRFG